MSLTILLADDSEIMRKAILGHLRAASDIQILGQASGFAQTIELAFKLHPQVIVLDVHMDDEYSVTLAQLKSGLMGSRVLAMSVWNDDETRSLAKAIGAAALLDKTTLATALIPALRNCADDQNRDQHLNGLGEGPVN